MSTDPRESGESQVPDLPEPSTEAVSSDDAASVRGGATYSIEAEKPIDQVFLAAKPSNASLLFNEGDSLFKK